jgi:hypothetical protein
MGSELIASTCHGCCWIAFEKAAAALDYHRKIRYLVCDTNALARPYPFAGSRGIFIALPDLGKIWNRCL